MTIDARSVVTLRQSTDPSMTHCHVIHIVMVVLFQCRVSGRLHLHISRVKVGVKINDKCKDVISV
jgi:hypothetical protein